MFFGQFVFVCKITEKVMGDFGKKFQKMLAMAQLTDDVTFWW